MNEMEGIEELINENTCGIVLEPIQGEGGVWEAEVEWLKKVVARAREVGAVVVFDEIQVSRLVDFCGTGGEGARVARPTRRTKLELIFCLPRFPSQCGLFRTGTMWAHSKYPVECQ